MKKIMLAACDPGGANTLIPLVPVLLDKGYNILLCGKEAALQRYRQFALDARAINDFMTTAEIDSWATFLSDEHPDFIITGTSGADFTERYLWKAAEKNGIKCIAILDQWINYGIRFSAFRPDEMNKYEQDMQHPYVPDYILVMDQYAQEQLIQAGIDQRRIKVSGQPYFDLLMEAKQQINQSEVNNFREKIGIKPNDFLITFISEPLSYEYNRNKNSESYLGYDEKSICLQVLEALNIIVNESKRKVHFLIKQHPRELDNNYDALRDKITSSLMNIRIEKSLDTWPLLLASDLVCGMSSMLLLEAIILGRPAISVQIGLKRDNPLILDQRGIMKSILQADDLQQSLRRILLGGEIPEVNWVIKPGAANKVIDFMEGVLCQN
ncbi:hypothetical protein [Syntrophomonas palmitatica]|uniref:hypothetical protein n=1 Tax=Syntrophomonas palmitatica TaxID=402877 RepID=UPI0006D11974|nr:hypothetical protein [Syntrophomonas palmitatica]